MSDPDDFPEVRKASRYAVDDTVMAGSIVAADIGPGTLNIAPSSNRAPMVTIDLATGRIEFGPDYDPDEAARQFWAAITRQHTAPERHFGPALAARIDQHLADGREAERRVRRLDEMAEAWNSQPPATIPTATVADAVHAVTRPNGVRP